jgi:hypothetical protein
MVNSPQNGVGSCRLGPWRDVMPISKPRASRLGSSSNIIIARRMTMPMLVGPVLVTLANKLVAIEA